MASIQIIGIVLLVLGLALIGVEMASFYAGTCFLPPAFGFFADWAGIGSMPLVLLGFSLWMLWLHLRFYRLSENSSCK